MPKYLMLSQLSEQGLQTLRANPERVREVNKNLIVENAALAAEVAVAYSKLT